jgi:effector-binding domain-containing protein
MAEFAFRSIPRQDTAVVRVTTDPQGIGTAMGEALPRAFAAVATAGGHPAGPPFTKYTAYSETSVEFETGVPVAAPFAASGDVVPGELGGCDAAVGMHVGPYDTIGRTYGELQAWIEARGRKPSAVMWEHYLTDPEAQPDPSTWRTEVVWPVE